MAYLELGLETGHPGLGVPLSQFGDLGADVSWGDLGIPTCK